MTEPLGGDCGTSPTSPNSGCGTPASPSLSRVVLTLESSAARQAALQHILNALQVMYARDCVIAALDTSASALPQAKEDYHSKYSRLLLTAHVGVHYCFDQTSFLVRLTEITLTHLKVFFISILFYCEFVTLITSSHWAIENSHRAISGLTVWAKI